MPLSLSLSFTLIVPLSLSHSLSSHLSQSQLSQLRYLSQPHSLNVVLRPSGSKWLPSPPLRRWVVVVLRPRGSKWLPSPPLCRWVVVVLRCALVSGLRSVCGFDVWVAGFGFGGFRRLGCWISGVRWRWWWWWVILAWVQFVIAESDL